MHVGSYCRVVAGSVRIVDGTVYAFQVNNAVTDCVAVVSVLIYVKCAHVRVVMTFNRSDLFHIGSTRITVTVTCDISSDFCVTCCVLVRALGFTH